MVAWRYRLDISDVWENESLTFEERRDAIVQRIKNAPWYPGHPRNASDAIDNAPEVLEEIVEELSNADKLPTFNGWWHQFYNWCDDHSVWVRTTSWM